MIVRPSGARTWRMALGAVPAGIWICMVVLIFVVWPAPRLRVLPPAQGRGCVTGALAALGPLQV